jgi:hypothetical protein
MTHTDISQEAAIRLNELTTVSLLDAVKLCIDLEAISKDRDIGLISNLRKIEYDYGLYYFAESTTSSASDPIKKVDSQIRNGFTTGGAVFDINKVPNWEEYENETRNIRYKAHSWLMIDSLLVADQIVEHNEYLQKAIDISDDWIINFIFKKSYDEFAWYDMAVGQRATKLAYIVRRLIEIKASEDQIFRFIIAVELHICELTQEDRIATHSNHGLFQMAGLLSLCHNVTWMLKSSNGIQFSERILKKMLKEHFAEDGLHLEHSPDYHLYMVNHLQSLKNSGWLSEGVDSVLKLLNSIIDAADWMCTPNHHVIPIGDTANNVLMTKRWGDYQGSINLGHRLFPIGGLLINNSKQGDHLSQLVFSAQFHSRQHKHADDLNVLYNLKGQPLLVDPGTYVYQYDHPHRMYCESTRGHNTVEIDGLNYSRFGQDGFGSALNLVAKAENCIIAEGKVNHKRLIPSTIPNNQIKSTDALPVKIHQRRIIIENPGYFLAVIDLLNSETIHEYTSWYHLHPNLAVRKDTPNRMGVYDMDGNKHCQIQCYDGDANSIEPTVVRGQIKPRLQGWHSKNGRELEENTAIGFPLSSKSYFAVTLFDFKMENTGIPYLRIGTSGKYLRFSLVQHKKKIDVRLRTDAAGKTTAEVKIDDSSVDVSIISND